MHKRVMGAWRMGSGRGQDIHISGTGLSLKSIRCSWFNSIKVRIFLLRYRVLQKCFDYKSQRSLTLCTEVIYRLFPLQLSAGNAKSNLSSITSSNIIHKNIILIN